MPAPHRTRLRRRASRNSRSNSTSGSSRPWRSGARRGATSGDGPPTVFVPPAAPNGATGGRALGRGRLLVRRSHTRGTEVMNRTKQRPLSDSPPRASARGAPVARRNPAHAGDAGERSLVSFDDGWVPSALRAEQALCRRGGCHGLGQRMQLHYSTVKRLRVASNIARVIALVALAGPFALRGPQVPEFFSVRRDLKPSTQGRATTNVGLTAVTSVAHIRSRRPRLGAEHTLDAPLCMPTAAGEAPLRSSRASNTATPSEDSRRASVSRAGEGI